MRAFWAILGVLMLVSAAYLLMGRESSGAPASSGQQMARSAPPAQPARTTPPPAGAARQPAPAPAPDPIEGGEETIGRTTFPEQPAGARESGGPAAGVPAPTANAATKAEVPAARQAPANENEQPRETAAKPDAPKPEAKPDAEPEAQPITVAERPEEEPETKPETKPETDEPAEPGAATAAAPDVGGATGSGTTAESPPATTAEQPTPAATPDPTGQAPASAAAPATSPAGDDNWLVTREDGSMVADGRYTIRGKGTREEPYKISWEHLISAEEDYVPREGRSEIPRRIQMLHEKHVEITGYVAFPMLMDEADELLVMLNQWDGCCIGVPPTPYDAVEVRLSNFVSGNARMTSYGTLKGVMKVEPHLVGEWLVGLYLMEHGELSPLAYGGFAP